MVQSLRKPESGKRYIQSRFRSMAWQVLNLTHSIAISKHVELPKEDKVLDEIYIYIFFLKVM